eukprot:COSAG02_NODE_28681_length_584_cov_3.841237_1_plen_21_part_10
MGRRVSWFEWVERVALPVRFR